MDQQWLFLDATGRRCTCLFMTPDGRVGTRTQLELRCKSQTMWTKTRLTHRSHKVIEKLDRPTDFRWVRDHPTYVDEVAESSPGRAGPSLRDRGYEPA
jgi:hypothetical protein